MKSLSDIILRIIILFCILHSVVPAQTLEEDVSPAFLTELLYMYDELPGVTKQDYYSPTAMVASPDGKLVYIAEYTARQVAFFDIASGTITKENITPELQTQLRAKLKEALKEGYGILENGGSSTEAVIKAIQIFNFSNSFDAMLFKNFSIFCEFSEVNLL